jgi:hypothetical protein
MFGAAERDNFFGFKDGFMEGLKTSDPDRINPTYTQEMQDRFAKDPEAMQAHRKAILGDINGLFHNGVTRSGSKLSQDFTAMVKSLTEAKLAKKPELLKYFMPNWSPGCRRPTPGPGFLESLVADNVTVIPTKVVDATETGLIDSEGTERPYDIVAFATGFLVDFRTPFP